jgi:hypothetical protein
MCNLQPQVVAKPADVVADLRGWLEGDPGGPADLELFGLEGEQAAAPEPEQATKDSPVTDLAQIEREIVQQDYETAACVSQEGELLLRKDGGKDYVQFTDDEVELFRDAIVTHNHPSGNSFSKEDIRLMLDSQMAEMRAVTRQWIHRMRPDEAAKKAGWEGLGDEINRIENDVKREMWEKIRTGRITAMEASAIHYHTLWARVQWTLKDRRGIDMGYRREPWSQ